MLAQTITIRVKSPLGFQRMQISSKDTLGQLKKKIGDEINLQPTDFNMVAEIDNKDKPILGTDTTAISALPVFQDGLIVKVEEKPEVKKRKEQEKLKAKDAPKPNAGNIANNASNVNNNKQPQQPGTQSPTKIKSEKGKGNMIMSENCNHPANQKCINCKVLNEETLVKKCTHGPLTKCVNCLTEPGKKIDKDQLKKEEQELFCKCKPGSINKCMYCLDNEYISNIKHIAFDQFLEEERLKCRGVHPKNISCNHCSPPSEISYKVNKNCKNHAPFPQARCNSCLPPNILLKQQKYRHVDYAQFQNVGEVQNLIKYWCDQGQGVQRMGWIYGYYAEDPNYKNGVRAIIEAFYEPPQDSDYNHVKEKHDPNDNVVNLIAQGLKMERIGWYYTTISQEDFFIDQETVRKIARFQQEYKMQHPSGYDVSKFITVVFRAGKEKAYEVVPEVYMVSDQCMALERDGILADSDNRSLLKIREPNPNDDTDLVPGAMYNGKPQKTISPAFMLVSIAHGSPSHNKFNILKNYDFPAQNRQKITVSEIQQYFKVYARKENKYSNFQLLVQIAIDLDKQSAYSIAETVEQERDVSSIYEELIKQRYKF